jgi:hypothetical protein
LAISLSYITPSISPLPFALPAGVGRRVVRAARQALLPAARRGRRRPAGCPLRHLRRRRASGEGRTALRHLHLAGPCSVRSLERWSLRPSRSLSSASSLAAPLHTHLAHLACRWRWAHPRCCWCGIWRVRRCCTPYASPRPPRRPRRSAPPPTLRQRERGDVCSCPATSPYIHPHAQQRSH